MRRINIARTVAVLLTVISIHRNAVGDVVTVDVNTWHQKISGFGACSAFNGLVTDSVGELMWSTTKGAGLSLHRVIIDRDGLGNDETKNALQAASYGVTVWGTPWWCKNGVQTGSGYDTLYEKDYQEWADTLAATANKMKNMGVPLYAISSGNEIDLGWTKYSAEALALWVGKYMGPTLAAKAPDVKVIGIETCNGCGFDYYYNYFKDNPDDAWKYSSILATHPYGCSPGTYPEINAAGKEYWQTEISDDKSDEKEDLGMGSALNVCKMIHRDLTVASVNAWHYWNVYGNNCGGLFTYDKVASKRLWIMGNWSRFVRPGFTRVEATVEPTSGVAITAFRDSALNRVVIVACNYNSSDVSQDFSITGTTPLQLTPFITDPTRDLVEQSTETLSSSSFTYSFPAQSVTSLIVDLKITPVEPRSSFEKIEAESYNLQSGIKTETCSESGDDIGFIENGDYAVYRSIDFGDGAKGFQARVASANSGGNIRIILDSITTPAAGTCQVSSTGAWQTWKTAACDISEISGKHDLYLKFTGGTGYLFNLNWFQFTTGTVGVERRPAVIKKGDFRTTISNGKIMVIPQNNDRYSFSVYSSDGRLVTSLENITGSIAVPLTSKGFFVINIKSKRYSESKKVSIY